MLIERRVDLTDGLILVLQVADEVGLSLVCTIQDEHGNLRIILKGSDVSIAEFDRRYREE